MRACAIAVGAVLTFASAALAEPANNTAKPVAKQKQPVAVVLASADPVRSPATTPTKTVSQPVKRVTPRVTTCRCGDPQADPDAEER